MAVRFGGSVAPHMKNTGGFQSDQGRRGQALECHGIGPIVGKGLNQIRHATSAMGADMLGGVHHLISCFQAQGIQGCHGAINTAIGPQIKMGDVHPPHRNGAHGLFLAENRPRQGTVADKR